MYCSACAHTAWHLFVYFFDLQMARGRELSFDRHGRLFLQHVGMCSAACFSLRAPIVAVEPHAFCFNCCVHRSSEKIRLSCVFSPSPLVDAACACTLAALVSLVAAVGLWAGAAYDPLYTSPRAVCLFVSFRVFAAACRPTVGRVYLPGSSGHAARGGVEQRHGPRHVRRR